MDLDVSLRGGISGVSWAEAVVLGAIFGAFIAESISSPNDGLLIASPAQVVSPQLI